ncbi:hypothetical protein Ancab_038045 [Ancistrocladus abbreviatus]
MFRKTGRFTAKACWLSLGLKRVLEVSVAALGEWRGDGWVWVFNWRWSLLQREEVWVRHLFSFLFDSKPNSEMEDGCKPYFASTCQHFWNSSVFSGWMGFQIQQKLVKLEGCFEEWQQHFRGDLFQLLLVLILPFR